MEHELGETTSIEDLLASARPATIATRAFGKVASFLSKALGASPRVRTPDFFLEHNLHDLSLLQVTQSLRHEGALPDSLSTYRSVYPDEPMIWQASYGGNSGGTDFFSPEASVWKATAEYLERQVWRESDEWHQGRLIHAGKNGPDRKSLDLSTIAGFSDNERARDPVLAFDESSSFGWVPALSLTHNDPWYVPAQLFSAQYARKFSKEYAAENPEPMLRWSVTTGLATGQTLEDAIVTGALEVIERDAFMITFLNKLPPPRIDLAALGTAGKDIRGVLALFKRYNLEVHAVRLISDFSIPIVGAILIDRTGVGPAFSIGAKASFTLKDAILGALSEALIVRLEIRRTMEEQKAIPQEPDSLRREERLLYWAPLERLPRLQFLFEGDVEPVSRAETGFGSPREALKRMLIENGCDIFVSELTPKNIRRVTPLRTIFAFSPQLQPLHLIETRPYRSGDRLAEVPRKLGYGPLREKNRDPHPFP